MAEDLGEKSEDATPKRIQDAREDGNIARSTDFAAAILLFGATVALWIGLGPALDRLGRALRFSFELGGPESLGPDALRDAGLRCIEAGLWALVPLVALTWIAGFAATAGQVGPLLAPKVLQPKLSKINPLSGFKRVFGTRGLVKAGLDSLKLALVLLVAVIGMNQMHEYVMLMPRLSVVQSALAIAELMLELALEILAVLFLLGILDLAWQRWRHKQDLKMTKQQVRDEFKQNEGDPQIKQRRLQFARQIAMQRMAAAVPKADVIVTNPEHISVAIAWNAETMNAPVVVAMGADHLAMRIRQIATRHRIPIVERKPLARALYRQVEVGQEIPPDHYKAVAEVLAFVYRLDESSAPAPARGAPASIGA